MCSRREKGRRRYHTRSRVSHLALLFESRLNMSIDMIAFRLSIAFALTIAFVIAYSPLSAQEDKGEQEAIMKKKTQELLAKAQEEYRVFFKKPENAIEFWSAIKFEMDLGKFDLAALHLKLMLEKEPPEDVDKDLVKLEQAEGMSAFLRLKQVRPKDWSDYPPFQKEAVANVDKLIDRITKAVEKHLSDPDRIKKFIGRLDAPTPEERAYAYVQLARSRERAAPYLIEAIRINHDKPVYPKLRETMLRIGPETVPVYLEVFKAQNDKDYRDIELRLNLLEIIRVRDDRRVIPYLWHMSASKKYPQAVREKAKETLASLLRISVNDLPPAREALVAQAERFYQHKVHYTEGRPVQIWRWDGQSVAITPTELTPYQAEEFFGMRYAREALDLDPSYQPAQVVLLSLMLERYYKPEVDQILLRPMPPKMHELLTTIDADVVMVVLDRALAERQIPVALPLIQALGERGELRAARPGVAGQPRGITKGLYDPDRRIQYASMRAMLKMPRGTSPPVGSERIVELSRRFLASSAAPKALIVHTPAEQEAPIRQFAKDLGYEAVLAPKVNDAVNLAKKTADFDLLILERGMVEVEFPFVYSQLRQHHDVAGIPMLVVVPKGRERFVQKLIARDPGVIMVTEDKFQAGDDLRNLVETHVKNVTFAKLSAAERKEFAKISMDTLWRMARGDIEGYNIVPAYDAIVEQLNGKEYQLEAIEILGRLPGKEVQYRLARIVANPMRDMKLRMPALIELNKHIHKHGLMLEKKQQADLKLAYDGAAEGTPFRTNLTVTMSATSRLSASRTGTDLQNFRPDPPAPPKEKEEKKEKDN